MENEQYHNTVEWYRQYVLSSTVCTDNSKYSLYSLYWLVQYSYVLAVLYQNGERIAIIPHFVIRTRLIKS